MCVRIAGSCRNTQGQLGVCINIRQCPALLNLLKLYSQDPSIGNYLRSNVCGYESNDPRLCCPIGTGESTGGGTGNDMDVDRDPKGVPSTEYGPLYPFECGFSNVSRRRIVGGEAAPLGTVVAVWFFFTFFYFILSLFILCF